MTLTFFWGAVGLVVYTYLLFPAIVLIRGRLCRRHYHCDEITPPVSLIIVAHNEADSIADKLDNILALDYPREQLEIIVASDGSTDATNDIVRGYRQRGIELLSLPRQGKIPALNAAVAAARGEILVFSDANSMYAGDAVRALVRPLADPQVGGVAGDQRYLSESSGENAGERAYWNLDRMLKHAESEAGSTISATGAIYATRRKLFAPVPSGVTDDFVNSTGVIEQGYRLVFAPDAAAYEPVAKAGGAEFARKVRVMTRGLRGVIVRRRLLNPFRYGFYAVQLFSHKVLRRLVVFPLLVTLLVSPLLWWAGPIYQAAAVTQWALYGCGLLGLLLGRKRLGKLKVLMLPAYFCLVNTAALLATCNILRGHRIELWEPQRRDLPGTSLPTRPVVAAAAERSAR